MPVVTSATEGSGTVQWEHGYEEWKQQYFVLFRYVSARSRCHGKEDVILFWSFSEQNNTFEYL